MAKRYDRTAEPNAAGVAGERKRVVDRTGLRRPSPDGTGEAVSGRPGYGRETEEGKTMAVAAAATRSATDTP